MSQYGDCMWKYDGKQAAEKGKSNSGEEHIGELDKRDGDVGDRKYQREMEVMDGGQSGDSVDDAAAVFDESSNRQHSSQASSVSSVSTNTALNLETHFLIAKLTEFCALYSNWPLPSDMKCEYATLETETRSYATDEGVKALTGDVLFSLLNDGDRKVGFQLRTLSENKMHVQYTSEDHEQLQKALRRLVAINDIQGGHVQLTQPTSRPQSVNTSRPQSVNTSRPQSVNTSRPRSVNDTSRHEPRSATPAMTQEKTSEELLADIAQTRRAVTPVLKAASDINDVVSLRESFADRCEWVGRRPTVESWTPGNSYSEESWPNGDMTSETVNSNEATVVARPRLHGVTSSDMSIRTGLGLSSSKTISLAHSTTGNSSSECQSLSAMLIQEKAKPEKNRNNAKNIPSDATASLESHESSSEAWGPSTAYKYPRKKNSIIEYYTTPGTYKMYKNYKQQREVSCYNFFKVFFFICCCCHGVKLDNNPDI